MEGRIELPKGTILDGSYSIVRAIGSGGFGVTYEAEDIKLGTKVAIKEYFPEEFGYRDASLSVRPTSVKQSATFEWGRTSFLQEARTLARFRHPSVVQVQRVFETYSTAYMVMAFEKGLPFEGWLKQLNRPPTQDELDRIVSPLLDALEMMHEANFLHRDIAPDNIIVRVDGTPVLLDFGAARRAIGEKSKALTGIVKAGFSPQEQYATDGRLQGPWTDLYALGATFYRAVTGGPPEEATLRGMDDRMPAATQIAKARYRPAFLAAIDACMRVKMEDRPQSVAQLRSMLHERTTEAARHPKALASLAWSKYLAALKDMPRWRLTLVVTVFLVCAVGLLMWARLPRSTQNLTVNCSFEDKEKRMSQTFDVDVSGQLISVRPGPFSAEREVWPAMITDQLISWTKEITVYSIDRYTGELTYRVHGFWRGSNWKCTILQESTLKK